MRDSASGGQPSIAACRQLSNPGEATALPCPYLQTPSWQIWQIGLSTAIGSELSEPT
jgi:hypothetical protein